MIDENKDRSTYLGRILGCIFCIPTIATMFLDWIRITFLNNLKSRISFFDFLDSDYTLIEIKNFLDKLGDSVAPQLKNLALITEVIEILAIASVLSLFIAMIFGKRKTIQIFGTVSFGLCTTMFLIFIQTLRTFNAGKSNGTSNQTIQLLQATPWPYVMLACSILLLLISVFLVDRKIID